MMQSSSSVARITITELLEALANKNAKRVIPWFDLSQALQQNFGYSKLWSAVRIRKLIDKRKLFEMSCAESGIVGFTTDGTVTESTIRATPQDEQRIRKDSNEYLKSLCKQQRHRQLKASQRRYKKDRQELPSSSSSSLFFKKQ